MFSPQQAQFRALAKERMVNTEAAKVSSAAVGLLGLAMGANPIFAFAGVTGGLMYAASLAIDYAKTGRLYLLPLLRLMPDELLDAITGNDVGQPDKLLEYLSPIELAEYSRDKNQPVCKQLDLPEAPTRQAIVNQGNDNNVLNQADYNQLDSPRLIDTLIQNPYQCRAIIAGQRTGKTYSAAMATRQLATQGTKIYYLNLFDHGQGNAEAFSHAECVTGDLTDVEDISLIMQAEILVKKFYRDPDAILVVDEFTNLGASTQSDAVKGLMEELSRKANSLASRGMASGKAIWAIAPFIKASVLTAEAKTTIKQFKPLVLSIPAGKAVSWTNARTGKAVQITADEQVINDVAANFSRSITMPPAMECDRCYWWNGEWYPVGKLNS